MSQQPNLLDRIPDRVMADTSLDAYAHVSQTLTERQISTFTLVHQYLDATGHPDVTGGELAAWANVPLTSVRPRITQLIQMGWLNSFATRASRAGELRCHPVAPAIPLSAIAQLSRKTSE